jgi:hypothetical protein
MADLARRFADENADKGDRNDLVKFALAHLDAEGFDSLVVMWDKAHAPKPAPKPEKKKAKPKDK